MTTWDEKAEDYAVTRHTFEHQHQVLDDLGYRWFVQGARWQREALLTDEAVERVAAVLADMNGEPRVGRFERTMARLALTAAIEGEQ